MSRKAPRLLAWTAAAALLLSSTLPAARAEYRPPTEVSLIVDGSDARHFRRTLEHLQWLVKYRNVEVREVLAIELVDRIGGDLRPSAAARSGASIYGAAPAVFGRDYSLLQEVGLPQFETVVAEEPVPGLEVTYSPVWIVHYLGKQYVFEGWTTIRRYFDAQGNFHIRR